MTQQEFFNRYKYSIRTDKVGGGAFGTVYRAFDEELNREVAIKVSEVKIMGGKEFSLKDEFDAIQELPVHRNIANYESLYTFEGPQGIFDYAVMQFYKDGNLSSFIKSNSTLAQKEQVALDLLEGIRHLHKHSIVHRDLKPGNILIVKRAEKVIPVITDFGLSKNAKMEGQSRFSNSFGGGTLKYSSPEQLKAEKLRLNTDLWAYGVIVHEIFTGKNLFMAQGITGASAEAEKEIYEQIIGVDISKMLNELPAKWKQVVEQCLVRDGGKRIKSAAAVKELILNGGVSPEKQEEFIDDKTIISNVAPEEMVDDQTVIDEEKTTQKEKTKKVSVKDSISNKDQPKQQKEYTPKYAYDAKAKAKKKRPIQIGVGVSVLLISVVFYFTRPNVVTIEENIPEEIIDISSNQEDNSIQQDSIVGDIENTSAVNEENNADESKVSLDEQKWREARNKNTADSYTSYLNLFPKGVYEAEANRKISELKKEEQAVINRLDLEAWNNAKRINTILEYKEYLSSFPKGKYRTNANEAILNLENEEVVQQEIKEELVDEETEEDRVFSIVEIQPEFPGGMSQFYNYVRNNFKYPDMARRMGIEGKVFVSFVVDKDGTVIDVGVVRGIGAGCDEEASRLLKECPKWKPGKQRGISVKVSMVIPITFKLSK